MKADKVAELDDRVARVEQMSDAELYRIAGRDGSKHAKAADCRIALVRQRRAKVCGRFVVVLSNGSYPAVAHRALIDGWLNLALTLGRCRFGFQ